MYYVDSDPDEEYDNRRSEEEIERLIKWGRGLKLIDEKEIKKLIGEFKGIKIEEKEEKGKTIEETESDITFEINTYRRINKIPKNGKEIKGEWHLINTRTITENHKNYKKRVWGVVKVVGKISLISAAIVVGVAAVGVIGVGVAAFALACASN
ncbi:AIG1 family protein [Entamoeba histolytica HM-3:IMSS]|uniref:AIG1 family protein n=1 Tax=Entamoeba histolytica HM-3:IMSS TaxID=885315 RepID=M7W8A7_ENTHI|nr:AIG1 family protein [Entamoeba histolytica HM-3:IMSS]